MFQCISCEYSTKYRSHYNKHLLTKKHKNNTEETSKCQPNVNQIVKNHKCHYCEQEYKHRQSLSRHLKICEVKKQNNEDNQNTENPELIQLKETVKLLKEQLKEKNNLISRRDKQIQTLIDKIGINTTHIIIIQTNNQVNNIKHLGYINTDYSHLPDEYSKNM